MIVLVLLLFTASAGFAGSDPVTIEADAGVNFDLKKNITTATQNVKVVTEGILIEADKVVYGSNTGTVEADGNVHLTQTQIPGGNSKEAHGAIEIFAEKIIYHNSSGMAEANGNVILIRKDAGPGPEKTAVSNRPELRIEAQKLNYEGSSGWVEATGNVRLKNGLSEYSVQSMSYNILDSTGKSGSFTAVLQGEPRNFSLTGRDLLLNPTGAEFSKVIITRCPKEKPDYTLTAQRITIVDTKVSLRNVILRIKGIPVFYFPILTFYTDRSMPKLTPGWDKGLKMEYDILLSSSSRSEWSFQGDLSSQGDKANLGLALRTKNGNSDNEMDIAYYYLDGYWKLADRYQYDMGNFIFSSDGSRDLSSKKESQFGLDLTRKYAETSLGRWRAGVSARWVSALDRSDAEYGGIYSGFRLDYQPLNHVTLSYWGIRSHTEADFRDLMEDFGTGGNGLYQVEIPFAKSYKFKMDGTYNFTESKWYHQVYRLTIDSCCFKPTFSYDQADQTWAAGLLLDF
jgi:lipopolysaccharide export system protein LptA